MPNFLFYSIVHVGNYTNFVVVSCPPDKTGGRSAYRFLERGWCISTPTPVSDTEAPYIGTTNFERVIYLR